MILLYGLESWTAGRDHLYDFLPLAAACFATAAIFAIQWLAGFASRRDQSFRTNKQSQQE